MSALIRPAGVLDSASLHPKHEAWFLTGCICIFLCDICTAFFALILFVNYFSENSF